MAAVWCETERGGVFFLTGVPFEAVTTWFSWCLGGGMAEIRRGGEVAAAEKTARARRGCAEGWGRFW